jgi:hypothetical protein
MIEFIDTFITTVNYKNSQSIFSRTLLPWLPRTRPVLVLWLTPDLRLDYLYSLEADHRKHIWVRVRVTLRLAVYRQSVSLATSPLRPKTRIFVSQLNTCGYSPHAISSLTRGWDCRLQLLLVLVSAVILRSESRGTHDHILLSQIWDSPNLEGQVPVFISPQDQGGPVIAPGTWFLFHRLLRFAEIRGRYSTPPPHGIFRKHTRYPAMVIYEPHRKHLFLYCCIYSALHRNGSYPIAACVFIVAYCFGLYLATSCLPRMSPWERVYRVTAQQRVYMSQYYKTQFCG